MDVGDLPDGVLERLPLNYRLITRWAKYIELREVLDLYRGDFYSTEGNEDGSRNVFSRDGMYLGTIPWVLWSDTLDYLGRRWGNVPFRHMRIPLPFFALLFSEDRAGMFAPVSEASFLKAVTVTAFESLLAEVSGPTR